MKDLRVALPCEVCTLQNGLRLIIHEEHTTPIVAVNLWYHVGSRDEQPGRTGLAHLFEHLMFEGSADVPPGEFDRLLEEVGGHNNGSTTTDRTSYWETVPANALELALFLEADRMGGLLPVLSQERFEAQRGVVMNERRENYDNRPYGRAQETILAALYPPDHPYHWPVIGFMRDLEQATLEDARAFYRRWYTPDNASLAVAGDVSPPAVVESVEKYFGHIPAGTPTERVAPPPVRLEERRHLILEDAVQLSRLHVAWHSPPAFARGDAELDALALILAAGNASRLYRALVAERQLAVEVTAQQHSAQYSSAFVITVTAKPGQALEPIADVAREEIARIAREGVTEDETERARNTIVTAVIDDLQAVGGFGGRADRLNLYEQLLGDPDALQRDLDRYLGLNRSRITEVCATILHEAHCVTLAVVPRANAASTTA